MKRTQTAARDYGYSMLVGKMGEKMKITIRSKIRGEICGEIRGKICGEIRGEICGEICGEVNRRKKYAVKKLTVEKSVVKMLTVENLRLKC